MRAPTTSNANKVAIYTRYSTDQQDSRSLEDQARRCRAFADAEGLTVVEVFSDAAVSGSHVKRAGLERLQAAVSAKGGSPFKGILVDDLSRLSRDIGDTCQLVFRDFAAYDVRVTDVTTRVSSDQPAGRMLFGTLGVVNDTFLQLVRAETHRGLEGRARAGFWTGGRVFGYSTVLEENPTDREHPRKRMVVNDDQAIVVRRVFELYVAGHGLKAIAKMLNEDGLPAPNDGGRGNKNGTGWGPSTIRAMLLNERYVGRVVWNKHKHVRAGDDRKSRRQIERPESEWIASNAPELAIVSDALWAAVRSRFERPDQSTRGRPSNTGKNNYLVAGLLRCSECGGNMTVVGAKSKGGVRYARFGCTAHSNRGSAICRNGLSVSEKKTSEALVHALQGKLAAPHLLQRFIEQFTQRARAGLQRRPKADDSGRQLRDCEQRVRNLANAIGLQGWSEALGEHLRAEEELLKRLKSKASAEARAGQPRTLPSAEVTARFARNLFAVLEADPLRGRELLSRFVGPIVMTPKAEGPDRGYRGTGAFNLSFFLSAATAGATGSGKFSCAGRI